MSNNDQLSAYSNVIEGALCSYDIELKKSLQDNDAIAILEMLLDNYHFSDENIENKSPTLISGFNYLEKAIQKDLSNIDREILVKIIGVIRFVANRRTKTGREYMNIIHQFVGQRIDSGVRVLSNFSA